MKLLYSFSVWLCHFTFWSTIYEWSNFTASLSAFYIIAFFFSHLFRYVVVSPCVIYISLIANDMEYFPLCLFAICLSSLVKWLFISFFLFFSYILLFCTVEFWDLLKCNLDARPFMDMWFTRVISQTVTYYFILFHREKVLNFGEV